VKQGLVAFLLAAAASASASMRLEPRVATTQTSVDAIFSFFSDCGVLASKASVSGSKVIIDTALPSICFAAAQPYTFRTHLGLLPAGVLDIYLRFFANDPPIFAGQVIVRDSEFLFWPPAVPTTGGSPIRVLGVVNSRFNGATVDGKHVTSTYGASDGDFFTNPHAPGTVDATVDINSDGPRDTTHYLKAALTYYDPAAPPDRTLFEPILFPVSYEGPGAFGTRWTTENLLSIASPPFNKDIFPVMFRTPPPCKGCGSTAVKVREPPIRLESRNNPWGEVLWAVRGTIAEDFQTESRVRVTSEGGSSSVQIPVVRERDLFQRDIRLRSIPIAGDSRVTLRIWSFGHKGLARVLVGQTASVVMTSPDQGAPLFGQIDLTSLFARLPAEQNSVDVRVSFDYEADGGYPEVWALLSITNNTTQQTALFWPQ
jgi:hypothetical protein